MFQKKKNVYLNEVTVAKKKTNDEEGKRHQLDPPQIHLVSQYV